MTRLAARRRSFHAMLAVFVVFVTGCTLARAGPDAPAEPNVPTLARPGTVLFVPDERRAALWAASSAQRSAWCGAQDLERRADVLRPVRALRDRRDGPDSSSEPFARLVMEATAAGFGNDDATARRTLAELLHRWAVADALSDGSRLSDNSRYALDRTLLPTIVGFWLIGDDLPPGLAERGEIAAWLERLVRSRGEGPERGAQDTATTTARNNHAYLRASVDMAWGALTGDSLLFARAIATYRQALDDMRRDGSLPLETRRGARALWYQRHALASLVTIAEMAAVQGHDLYGMKIDGRDLHRGIRFLLDGIDDPGRVRRYAKANVRPGTDSDYRHQDLSFLERRGHGRHYMAWAEIYMARFPDRPEAHRLQRLLARTDQDSGPMIDDYSGGNTTCFFAPVGAGEP